MYTTAFFQTAGAITEKSNEPVIFRVVQNEIMCKRLTPGTGTEAAQDTGEASSD